MVAEFIEFVRKYGVIGLAIGFVTGTAATQFVNVLSASLLTPLVEQVVNLFGENAFQSLNVGFNGSTFAFGDIISGLINFLAIMAFVFLLVKFVISKWMTDDEKGKV